MVGVALTAVVIFSALFSVQAKSAPSSFSKTCPEGYIAISDPLSGKIECSCLPYHLYWPLDGLCYRESTRGPCQPGFRFNWNAEKEQAECQCPPFWSRHSEDGICYEEYTQGPCSTGQLFVDSACACSEEKTPMHLYPETKQCFQLYTHGPCSAGQTYEFNYRLKVPECICKEDHFRWTDGNCYEQSTIGPCNATECPKVRRKLGKMCLILNVILSG